MSTKPLTGVCRENNSACPRRTLRLCGDWSFAGISPPRRGARRANAEKNNYPDRLPDGGRHS